MLEKFNKKMFEADTEAEEVEEVLIVQAVSLCCIPAEQSWSWNFQLKHGHLYNLECSLESEF